MKFLIDNINSVCGRIIVAVFVASITHLARDSIAIFETVNFWRIVDYVQYAFIYLASLSFTADATSNVSNLFGFYLDLEQVCWNKLTNIDETIYDVSFQILEEREIGHRSRQINDVNGGYTVGQVYNRIRRIRFLHRYVHIFRTCE